MKRAASSVPDKLFKAGNQDQTSASAEKKRDALRQNWSGNDLVSLSQGSQQRRVTRLGDWVAPRRPTTATSDERPSAALADGYQFLAGGDVGGNDKISSNGKSGLIPKVRKCLVSSIPMLTWLPAYDVQAYLFYDVVAGVTLALICMVQTLAHAAIASTNVIQGPYCAFVPPLVYAMLGTSRHASISSGAIVAILLADQVQAFPDIQDRTEAASLLAFISGCMLVFMGLCKAAFAVRFLSQSLISGFVTGGAMLIIQGQLKNLLGLLKMPHTRGFFPTCRVMVMYLPDVNIPGTVLGVLVLIMLNFMVYLKSYASARLKATGSKPAWLKPLKMLSEMKEILVVIFSVLFARLTVGPEGEHFLPLVGHIPQGLPDFAPPWSTGGGRKIMAASGENILNYFVGGTLLALTSFLTTYATAKKQALNHNYRIDASQDMFALGMAAIGGSFYGSFTPSGSLSRTSLSSEVGVKTQLNGIMTTCIIGIGLMYLTPLLYYLPKATLAAIIIKSAWSLVDHKTALELWRAWLPHREGGQKRDLLVWCIAFLLTLCFGALFGILGACVVALALIVYDAATPQAVSLGRVDSLGGLWRNVEVWPEGRTYPGVLVVEYRGPLCFASAEGFEEELEHRRESSNDPVRIIVLHFGSVHDLDTTALAMLKELLITWKKMDISCIVAEAKSRVRLLLEKHFAKGTPQLLSQPAFIISLDDAVDLALRQLENRGFGEYRRSISQEVVDKRAARPNQGNRRFEQRMMSHIV